ncbi:DUF4129 domain-containing protein [Natrinema ejinorense]|uniref:DUF4129 domain-containing protein n=1 Tax=Natrinema ejinorense TaxID=373386 RepID=A0A2A5QV04_9EURY|nr:DUF4129 domain-containing protein [Natrinema ejinorense]PCR90681.1 DUF4129 domain-containing protein [Natrinema ejinorense]
MTGTRRFLFVVGCLCCLLAVASALPAADPRIEGPGEAGGEPIAGDWESIDETPEFETNPAPDTNETTDERDREPNDDEIDIEGAVEPGNEVTVDIGHVGHFDEGTIAVNGENVTSSDMFGNANITVPYAEEMTVSVPDENRSRTVDVRTDATLETHGGAAPARDLEISAAVGSTPVPDATVRRDGEAVATTDEDGHANVTLPETARDVDLQVERGPVTATRTVDVAEPTVRFVSPLLFPGMPAPVQVSAGGEAVSDATVRLENGGTATTGSDGKARLWLPVGDEATVTVDVGAETATATVGNLYLRLTAVVVLVPGFCIGGVLTYLRVVAARERRRGDAWAGFFVALAAFFDGLAEAFARFLRTLGGGNWPSLSLPVPSVSFPTLSIPRLEFGGFGRGFPALPSIGRTFGTLPSLGSPGLLGWSSNGSERSVLGELLGSSSDESDESTDSEDGGPTLAAEPLTPRGPRAEVRAAWHAFLDRLGVEDRETTTPGEVARDALAAGFRADRVDRLVGVVRDIEYGGHEPSPDRVAAVRATVRELLESDSDEEGST